MAVTSSSNLVRIAKSRVSRAGKDSTSTKTLPTTFRIKVVDSSVEHN